MSKVYARRRLSILAALTGLTAFVGALNGPTASAALPTPIAASTARTYLSSLTVAAEDRTGYDRSLFPHWITISGTCDTRETVLKRDGSNVVTDSACASTSGSWYSEYDGTTLTSSSGLDIDHLVPLAEAWDSGASTWTTAQRQAFANDLTRPQLIAVSAGSNRSKGDKDPAEWLPTRSAYVCTYARAWVQVKHYYKLSVDTAEKSALQSALKGC
ncbi:HNH endonuclease family protein [Streptomyces sp. RY43-2]|uniref:HNH endonuclease family protein n=1 Tax=Streptomyces macrolidinus TaxID=2952607 RepID=A0ABT0ZJ50_9ACTN|nr:HNH endonuclease family protein [Streptomyces macrolidinus]MCN9243605.1 HNH endonuclease family protein [Streptomyces macrolidinus]